MTYSVVGSDYFRPWVSLLCINVWWYWWIAGKDNCTL